ncbi:low molecular weight phosphatase family protein [Microbacterium sp. SSW1-47]|uniref:arsenate reductase/protein-tyrosine-phosphatase family protein n=1 Tax=Microbacterium sufflavum TaxID=2851649 RepID=UPI0024909383|nr:low molecular weight phosphatase family protein [Microbacterium sufflavum]MCK2026511.1 low molecular weight phosphatase family protein [Microbacterium sufflavum]
MSRREWREHQASGDAPAAGPIAAPFLGGPVGDDDRPLTILTVCTGNICRSPLAEVLLRARLEPLGVKVHSAGTHALVGHAMTEPAQQLAIDAGARADAAAGHSARYLREPLLLQADLVLTMAREHSAHAIRMVPSRIRRTFTAREFARLCAGVGETAAQQAADAGGTTPRARFAALLSLLAEQRGFAASADENDDVIDPYRRSAATYAKSAGQLLPALDEVERMVRASLA